MRKIISIFLVLFALGYMFSSCTKTFDPGTTATPKTSNGWWVTWYDTDGNQYTNPTFFSTYNTSENKTDSMWIDDLENFWQFKGKVALDYTNMTFASTLSENQYYPSEAKIMNGKIIPKGGHSKTGVVTDSIYFEIQFSDDGSPEGYGTTFYATGTARTGFIDDNY
jgi:hypothetical protein